MRRRLAAAAFVAGVLVAPATARPDAAAQVTIPTLPTLPTTTSTTEATTTTTEAEEPATTTTTEGDGEPEDESTTTTEATTTTTEPEEPEDGTLSISAPVAVQLSADTPISAGSLSASLGTVTVHDTRGAVGAAWTATVTASSFVTGGGTAAETIDRANVAYWSGPLVASAGIGVFTPGQLTAAGAVTLEVPRTAFRMASGIGDNSVSWSPTVVVAIPPSAIAGVYTGTITHSVA